MNMNTPVGTSKPAIFSICALVTFLLVSSDLFSTDRYWIGGTGNWSNSAHWSSSSGGASCGCTPAATDNVYFDANSFSGPGQSVTIDVTANCDSMSWSAISFAAILTGGSDLHINGSLALAPAINITNFTGNLYFSSGNVGNMITSYGHSWYAGSVNFNGGGNWTLQDAFVAINTINFTSGTLTTNNKNLGCGVFSCTGSTPRSLILGSSTVIVTNCCTAWNSTGSNFTLNAGTSLIKFVNTNSYTYLTPNNNETYYDVLFNDPNASGNINGGTANFHNITCNGGGSIAPGSGSTFNDITFNNNNAGTISPGVGSTIHNVYFNANGSISAGSGSTFNNVTFNSNASISTSGNNFNDVVFNGPATVSNTTGLFVNANFKSDANITSNINFDSLLFAAGHIYTLSNGTMQTINNYFQANGTCAQLITLQSNSAGNQATISKASGTVTVNNIFMKDMNATGGATFIANNSTNLGNNTGWTLNSPTAQNLYWVGNNGNWSNPANWSTSSGGPGGACIPNRYDNVYFDANSFSSAGQNVTVDITAYCDSMNWSAITFPAIISGSSDLHVYGSLRLSAQLTPTNFTGNLNLNSVNAGNVIASIGRTWYAANVNFNGTGNWTFLDAFAATNAVNLMSGTVNTNNKNFNCGSFSSTGNYVRSLTLGTSTVTISACCTAWNISGSNFALSSGTSLLKFTNTNSYTYLIAGNNDTYYDVLFVDPNATGNISGGTSHYHNVTCNGGGSTSPGASSTFNNVVFNNGAGTVSPGGGSSFNNVTFASNANISTGGTTFNDVTISGAATISNAGGSFANATLHGDGNFTSSNTFDSLLLAAGHNYTFSYSNIQTINKYFQANGTCGQLITFVSSSAGNQATISKATGTVTVNYVSMRDMNALGGATFNTSNVTNLGNNTGWNLVSPTAQNLYWVGGTGNWSSTSHWSTTSGGPPGTCLPTRYDNVYFDANSFTASGQSVTIDVVAYCDSMNWGGISFAAILTGTPDLHVYGSLKLNAAMNLTNYTGNLYFNSPNLGNMITSAGKSIYAANVYFNGGGAWALQDAFSVINGITLTSGALSTNNKNMSCSSFASAGASARSLVLGTSTVTVSSCCTAWNSSGSNFSLVAGTSLIKFTNTNSYTYLTPGLNDTYYDVLFLDQVASGNINGATANFHNVTINGGGTIAPGAGSTFNDVTFNNNNAGTISPGVGSTFHNVFFNAAGTINTGPGCGFNNVTFNSNATINTSSNTFNDVLFNGPASVANNGGTFVNANFKMDGNIQNNTTFDTLMLAPGHIYQLAINTNQTINNLLKADGTCSNFINLKSNSAGTQATITKSSGSVTLSFITMKDINATGGATFTANGSTNVSNNTGWIFPNATLIAGFTHTAAGQVITFSNTSQYSTSWLWKFGDGQTSTQQSPVHTYTAGGVYNACLVASNSCGTKDSTCHSFTVCPTMAIGFTDTITGQTVTFTNISQNASSFTWYFGDGNSSNVINPIHTYNFGGGYIVTLIATNACGERDTIRKQISVNCTPPVAGFAGSATGLLVNFINSSTNAANVLWKYGDGNTSTSLNSPHTYFNSGTYTVCLIVSNGCGKDSSCQNITVTCVPPVASYTYGVNGMTAIFANTSSNAPVAHWDFGDGQTSTLISPSHTYLNSGTYNVKLKVNNGCGHDSTIQALTIVCVQPTASFYYSEQGLAVDFVSTSSNAPNVQWDFGDGTGISILPVINHAYATTGTYTVCLTASNGCGTSVTCSVVAVCIPPTASYTYVTSALTTTLTNTSINGTNYLWTFGDAYATNNTNAVHTYSVSGTHTVCLNVSNTCGSNTICYPVINYCSPNMNQQLCLVTVDSLSKHNILYWQKPPLAGIDSFIIYREVTSNVYKRIGARSKDSLSMFTETATLVGPANGNPNVGTYRYKIQVRDSCGNYGPKGPYHNTVFFVDNHTGTFTWNKYLIELQANTPVTQFNLLRDNNNNGMWQPIGSVAGTQTTLNDPNYLTYPNANWRVEAIGFNCTPSMRLGNSSTQGTVVRAKSNITNNRGIGINQLTTGNIDLLVYPNPGHGVFNLTYSFKNVEFVIVDLLGNTVKRQLTEQGNTIIDLSNQAPGTYILQLQNTHVRLVKE